MRQLPELLTRKKVGRNEITAGQVTGAWRRLVYANPNGDPDVVDHRAYTFLQLTEQPDQHLAEITGRLDADRAVAPRLPDNAALELIRDGERLSLERLDAEPEPPSLVELRRLVGGMLPRVDITDALLEVHGWTSCFDEYTHISEARARMEDLPISVAAVLVAEACNIGFRPLVKPSVPALTRDRLSHVDQNYVRAENHARANGAWSFVPIFLTARGAPGHRRHDAPRRLRSSDSMCSPARSVSSLTRLSIASLTGMDASCCCRRRRTL